ncbi:hypothetical protein BCR32DRAFT_268046 [Anaeromyces robustus]|uniref:Uncharacterized protein n=1 Tax=Anaeromyces robustus TaxID=1754192 RepID=A0A1Y1X7T2_9FUNG|nr:hypothetical protein BCR32DRAFT_268046 [Anaeromyces robustus]|eukprot:ORX81823.1 hypothetical protein BCR32DRAFT_268046 [Anaeromyces robustus]
MPQLLFKLTDDIISNIYNNQTTININDKETIKKNEYNNYNHDKNTNQVLRNLILTNNKKSIINNENHNHYNNDNLYQNKNFNNNAELKYIKLPKIKPEKAPKQNKEIKESNQTKKIKDKEKKIIKDKIDPSFKNELDKATKNRLRLIINNTGNSDISKYSNINNSKVLNVVKNQKLRTSSPSVLPNNNLITGYNDLTKRLKNIEKRYSNDHVDTSNSTLGSLKKSLYSENKNNNDLNNITNSKLYMDDNYIFNNKYNNRFKKNNSTILNNKNSFDKSLSYQLEENEKYSNEKLLKKYSYMVKNGKLKYSYENSNSNENNDNGSFDYDINQNSLKNYEYKKSNNINKEENENISNIQKDFLKNTYIMRIIDSTQEAVKIKRTLKKGKTLNINERPRWVFGRGDDNKNIYNKVYKLKEYRFHKDNNPVNITSIIKNNKKKNRQSKPNEENDDINLGRKKYIQNLDNLLDAINEYDMIDAENDIPSDYDNYGRLWDITISTKQYSYLEDPRHNEEYNEIFEELITHNPFDYLMKFKSSFINDYSKLIEYESKKREEAFEKITNNDFSIKDDNELDEIEGICMIWRVYMYLVSSIEPIIPKDIAIEILKVFVTKEYDTDEKIIYKLKEILTKLNKSEYLYLKLLIGHIYRIGCLSKRNILYGLSFIFGNYIFRKAWESFYNSKDLHIFLGTDTEENNNLQKKRKKIHFLNNSTNEVNNMKNSNNIDTEMKEVSKELDNNYSNNTEDDEDEIIIDENFIDPIAIRDPLCIDPPEFLYFFAKLDPLRLFMVIYLRIIILDFPSYVFYFILNNFEVVFSWTYAQTMKKVQLFKL